MDKDEKRGYAKGYKAGRKKIEAELAEMRRIDDRAHSLYVNRRDAFFCAALNGLLPTAKWTNGGKDLKSMDDYIALARKFAEASVANMSV